MSKCCLRIFNYPSSPRLALSPSPKIRSHLKHRHTHRSYPVPLRSRPSSGWFSYTHYTKQSGLGHTAIVSGVFFSIAALIAWSRFTNRTTSLSEDQQLREITFDVPYVIRAPEMPPEIPPGRPGNLTADQETKLREFWEALLHIIGVWPQATATESNGVVEGHSQSPDSKKKKRRFGGLLHRKEGEDSDSDAPSDDKYGQTKEFKQALASQSPQELNDAIWSMVKCDDPDALLCRYLRARSWDVQKAMVMLVSTMRWRWKDMKVDDDIMQHGEGDALEHTKNGNAQEKKEGEDFLQQIRMGKSFLHGTDVDGRPMCVVRVRLHRQGEQSENSLEKYTVYTIETARFLLRPPVDTATIVFDMTGFSMANMDYAPVKFMIKCFEANYPESLGAVLVHKAPWVFHGIWTIIKGWLDPVVASKVHFTKDVQELSKFVPMSQIPTELSGDEKWEYKYVEPGPDENVKMKDTATRDKILKERRGMVDDYEKLTIEWCKGGASDGASKLKEKRIDLAEKLRQNYWKLDPYVRARSLYDRTGVIKPGGSLEFYPKANETSAGDVD